MKSYQLCRTVTPKGTRYYINSKRVSRDTFELAQVTTRQDTFVTRSTKKGTRHFSNIYLP